MIRLKLDTIKFNNEIRKQIAGLERGMEATNINAANRLILETKLLAPKLTRKLINSIHRKTLGKNKGQRVSINAVGNKGFAYSKWINQSPGYETLHGYFSFIHPIYGRRVSGSYPRTYGSTPSHWTRRGEPKFFDKAAMNVASNFKNIAISSFNRTMRIKIRGG